MEIMPKPNQNETHDQFINRCMGDDEMVTNYENTDQRYAVCEAKWQDYKGMSVMDYYLRFVADNKVSFDYDDVLSTEKGKELANRLIKEGALVYIISARRQKDGMINTAKALGIPESRIYATGSNKAKIEKVKELGIKVHYDNNPDVINELGDVGKLFTNG
jgi:hypothetical protein